jgi:uncharacterized protein (DUF58 family)
MITARGWWFLLIVLSVLAFGVFDGRWTLTLLALTLLLWFIGAWLMFVLRLQLVLPGVRIRRQVCDERGLVDTLWAGRSFQVRVEVRLHHWLGLPYVRLADQVPSTVELAGGDNQCETALTSEASQSLGYRIRCLAPGLVRFEGMAVTLADLQGFFYHAAFFQAETVYRTLPSLADARGHRPTVKRNNVLPAPGIHRHLRTGSGSELLDLRDYLPGDPPKTIAWKISARRDRLITKEFESEVPLRCTLFADVSHSVRVGVPGHNALARLVDIAAAVAQATAASRDLTGLCLFDEKAVLRYIRPARGSRHLIELLNVLADAAALAPASGQAKLTNLLPRAYAFAQQVYPDLLRDEINQVPPEIPWSWPAHSSAASWGERLLRRVFLTGALLTFVVTSVVLAWVSTFDQVRDALYALITVFLPIPEELLGPVAVGLILSATILYFTLAEIGYRSLRALFSPRWRRLVRWRKKVAALLSELHGMPPGSLAAFCEDDQRFVLHLQQFLAHHHVPYPVPFYDTHGRYLFASPGKIEVLARALVRAVRNQHDNELFILMVDLLELADEMAALLRAIKVVLARHHQVLVICPWPPGLPAPPAFTQPGDGLRSQTTHDLSSTVDLQTAFRFHQAFHRLQRTFARLRVPFVCAQTGDPVTLILERLDRLRSVGLARKQ